MDLSERIDSIKGIGAKSVLAYQRLGIFSLQDLLDFYPRTYESFDEPVSVEEIEEGMLQSVYGTIVKKPDIITKHGLSILHTTIGTQETRLKLTWFRMPYLRSRLQPGCTLIFRGRVMKKGFVYCMEQAQIFTKEEYEQQSIVLQPVYSLTQGLTSKSIGKSVRLILESFSGGIDYLPCNIREQFGLCDYNTAIRDIHFPQDFQALLKARNRLVFDEFLTFILMIDELKQKDENTSNSFSFPKHTACDLILEKLPYKLTTAQQKVWEEIKADMQSGKVMNRLIQGDVGSGKTILAILSMIYAAENGYQGAIMAPTEVLAKQHFDSFCILMSEYKLPIRITLLTGSMTAADKKKAQETIRNHETDLIIGTHALIQDKVIYDRLALVITDEQHRFGVRQRETFSKKGELPHTIIMSATPIPRTLAMIIYADMDISVIDELPGNRLPIKNCVVNTSFRAKAYQFMKKEIEDGRQVYIICPMVEDSEKIDAENVLDYADSLRSIFPPEIKIEALHGRMKQQEKDRIMSDFHDNKISVLISTTVIEVGINVPNATVMMIENAERFGLSQLHQLRGRIGRGRFQSYCIFMSGTKNKEKNKRLEVLNKSNDGFFIAAQDLKLRGPGDVFGLRQSGLMDFRLADVYQDANVLQDAKKAADLLKPKLLSQEADVRLLSDKINNLTLKNVVL